MNDQDTSPELTAEEQVALADARASGGDCPQVEELVAFTEARKTTQKTSAIERHLLTCAPCQELVDRLAEVDPSVDDLTWKRTKQGLDERSRPWAAGRSWYRSRSLLTLAATLVLFLLLPLLWVLRPQPEPESTFRGSPILQLEPGGNISEIQRFRWNAPPSALSYRVVVQTVEGRDIWQRESPANVLRDLEDLPALLEPGASYRWKVEGRDAQGRVLAESGWLPFSLSR